MNIENPTSNKANPDESSIIYGPGIEDPNWPSIITPADVKKEEEKIKLNKEEMREHKNSILSKASYDYYKDGYIKANNELHKYLPNHNILYGLSDPNATVIQKRNHIIISYRGTDPQNISDLTADGQILAGNNYSDNIHGIGRFKEAENKYEDVKKAYPDSRVTLTGHSLGGALGIHTGRKYDLEGTFFNPGQSLLSLPTEIKEAMKTRNNNFTIHHTFGDPISSSNYWLDKSDKIITHYIDPITYAKQWYKGEVGGHPLSNFIEEDHQLEWTAHSSQMPYSLGLYLPKRVIDGCKGGNCNYLKPQQRPQHILSNLGINRPAMFLKNNNEKSDCVPCPKGKIICDCFKAAGNNRNRLNN